MANLMQIKRSTTADAPGALANGELAYTANGDVLFIGSNSTVVPIGGVRNPGQLTANQALVANASGYLDTIKAANAVVNKVYANGSHGTAGYVLSSGGSSDNVYWVSTGTLATSPGGVNTNIQFNDSGTLGASADFTFDKVTKTAY